MPESKDIEKWIRPELFTFGGYSAATSPETLAGKIEVPVDKILKLDANENPYGCSPRVNRALSEYSLYNTYPDDGQENLRKLLATYTGVDTSNIVAGNGSNQLIDLILRLLINKGDEVINIVPTFGIYSFSTNLCGGTLVNIDRDDKFNIDIDMVKKAITGKTKIIMLANPNNPTGNLMPRKQIIELLNTGLPVLVDEAYYEFSQDTVAPLIADYGNLMVLRTFSKWAGLAGLRVGYGIFPAVITDYLLRTKIPYNVNVAALVAVKESFEDIDFLKETIEKIIAERERLFEQLQTLEWLKPFPSRANFILCRVLKGNAKELHSQLRNKGILIRYFEQPRLKDCIRISVGKPEHTDAIMKALRETGG